jgi:putative transposase
VNLTPFGCPHPPYRGLAATPEARGAAYRKILQEALAETDLAAIRGYLQQQRAWGRDDFRTMVEAKIRRFAGIRPAHRPARDPATAGKRT